MQVRPAILAETDPDLSASAQEHILGPIESSGSPTPPLTRHRSPLPALTGLRFFAASYVVIFHTRVAALLFQAGHPFGGRFFLNGYLAVTLFFILSGFILAYTYRGQIHGRRGATRFWEARFARLWPAYAFSLLCSSIPSLSLPSVGLSVATLCMVQAWNPWHPEYSGSWNFVCWTLSVEAFFYVIFPLVQRGAERLRFQALALIGSVLLCAGVAINCSFYTLGVPGPAWPWNRMPLPVVHTPEFLVGVALGNFFVIWRDRGGSPGVRMKHRWPLLTGLGVVFSILALATLHGALTSLVLLPFSLLVIALAGESSAVADLLSTPVVLLGGAISYSMYLLQSPVRAWVHAMPANFGVLGLLIVPTVLIPFSLFAYKGIEEPARLGLRQLFARASGPGV